MDEFPYEMLEELKDGKAESTKYNSIKLQVNTPNTTKRHVDPVKHFRVYL